MPVRRIGGLLEEELTYAIIGGFHHVYNTLGYGHAEATYMNALERELVARRLEVAREVSVRVYYDGEPVGYHRLDMLVNDTVVVEAKATEFFPPYAKRQVMNYLRATRLQLGLILHFGPSPKHHRVFCATDA